MKCSKCGKELNKDEKFCGECGQEVSTDIKKPVETEKVKPYKMEKDTLLCVISVIMFFGGPTLSKLFTSLNNYSVIFGFLSKITAIFPFVAFAIAIYTKIKYRESKFAKILIIIYIICFILVLLLLILFIIACVGVLKGCSEMDWSGCSSMGNIIRLLLQK